MKFSAFLLQAVPPAPGRGDESAPPPVQGTTAPGSPQPAPHGPAAPGGLAGMFPLLLLVPMVIAMLWMNSKQQKKQKELEESLKTGDRVVTNSGLIGKLTDLGGRYVKIEIAPGIKVQMLRTAIASLDSGEEKPIVKADAKADERAEEKKISAKADDKKKADDKPKADDKARSKSDSASK